MIAAKDQRVLDLEVSLRELIFHADAGNSPEVSDTQKELTRMAVTRARNVLAAECAHYFESWNDTCRYCGAVKPTPFDGSGDANG